MYELLKESNYFSWLMKPINVGLWHGGVPRTAAAIVQEETVQCGHKEKLDDLMNVYIFNLLQGWANALVTFSKLDYYLIS